MTHLLLLALLAQAPDAGSDALPAPGPVTVESLYLNCPDAPLAEVLDGGGYFVPEERARREGCKLAACESVAAARLREDQDQKSHPGTVLILIGGGVVLATTAFLVGFFLPHPNK